MRNRLALRSADQAREDLRETFRYLARRWGRRHAEQYRGELRRAVNQLRLYPELGSACDDVGPEMRCLPIRQHVVYYVIEDKRVTVYRVLDARRDPAGLIDGASLP